MKGEHQSSVTEKFSWFPLFWGLAGFVVAILGPSTAHYVITGNALLIIIVVGLLAVYLIIAIYNGVVRTRYLTALSYIFPHLAIVLLVLCEALGQRVAGFNIYDAVRFRQFSRPTCIRSANDLGNGKSLGVCISRLNSIAVTANAIIYDSSDEIALPPQNRASRWTELSSKIKGAPFGALNFKARSMGYHFYDVDFSIPSAGKSGLS